MTDLNIPPAPAIDGATPPPLGQGARPLRAARRRPADGRERPDLDLRLRARHDDPRQGRDPDPDVAVVVRAAGRPGAEPRGQLRGARCGARPRGGLRAARRCIPVECVARGYLTGSGLLDYRATGPEHSVCGVALPAGLEDGSRLPAPIFTPATKAELGDHDENVSYDVVAATDRRRRRRAAARPDPRRSTAGPSPSPGSGASSWPTPSSSSGSRPDGTGRCSPTRC